MVASIPKLLSKIIDKDLHERIDKKKKSLRLCEPKTVNQLSVIIECNKPHVFCFSIDKDRNAESSPKDLIFPFFNPREEGILSKADYIVVAQKQKKVCIFLIELKSTSSKGYLKQIHSAKLFMQFVLDKARLCHPDFKNMEELEFEYKGILFHEKPILDKEDDKKSKNKKLPFEDIGNKGLLITRQTYDNVYYLSQFF